MVLSTRTTSLPALVTSIAGSRCSPEQSDGPHIVKLSGVSALNYDQMIEVTGASPSLSGVSGYTNNQFPLSGTSGISIDNGVSGGVDGYPFTVSGQIRFKATTSTLKVWMGYCDGRVDHCHRLVR
jgi:hypothetical protein